jgi:hypothetical protein
MHTLGTVPVEQVAHILAVEYVRKSKELNESSPAIAYANIYIKVYQQILSRLRSEN